MSVALETGPPLERDSLLGFEPGVCELATASLPYRTRIWMTELRTGSSPGCQSGGGLTSLAGAFVNIPASSTHWYQRYSFADPVD